MRRPVLVVGDNALAGLQTVRSLGRAGLEVHLVAFESGSVTRYSRYVTKTLEFGNPLTDTDQFVHRVLTLVRETPFELLVPTSDKSLVPLMAVRDEIRQHVPFDPSDDSVEIADPYRGDRARFRDCYSRVIRCVDELHRFTMGDS
ncbi:MAG: hypothetical protein FJ295_19510 [Planctomycetes bacterium]|nr:hypothetical protein [Planctomycetota bacterium]